MDSLNRVFASINEAKKAKTAKKKSGKGKGKGKAMIPTHHEGKGGQKSPLGSANCYDHDHKPKAGKKVNASTEIANILNLIKEAYQDELISEEAFLAIADPIMRSLMNEVTFPDTYEKEDLDDAEAEDEIAKKAKPDGSKKVTKSEKPSSPNNPTQARRSSSNRARRSRRRDRG